MRKLSIKSIIEFRRKSDRSKKKFATDINLEKQNTDTDGGGDYWVSSLSAMSNSYRSNEPQIIKDKIEELEGKFDATEPERTKAMYKRNIDILYNYEDFDFKKWRPSKKIIFIKKHKTGSILTIRGLEIQANPHHVFTFFRNDIEEIGAIWFIAKLKGYQKDELGMFTDILHRYLVANFSDRYEINPQYCIAVDVVENFAINYSQIQRGEIPAILSTTIGEIKKLM